MTDQELPYELVLSVFRKQVRGEFVEATEEWLTHEIMMVLQPIGDEGLNTYDIEQGLVARMDAGVEFPGMFKISGAEHREKFVRAALRILRDQSRVESIYDGVKWRRIGILDTIAREAAKED